MLLSKFRDAKLSKKNVFHSEMKAFWILVLCKQLLNWLNNACEVHKDKCGQYLKEYHISILKKHLWKTSQPTHICLALKKRPKNPQQRQDYSLSVPSPSKLMRIIPPNSIWAVDLSKKKRGFLVRISTDWGTKGNQELQEILWCLFYAHISLPLIWKAIGMHSVKLP